MHSIQELQLKFGTALNQAGYGKGEPRELYEPIQYIMSIGGKRIRPVAVLMACELFGGDFNDAIYPAMAIEVFHNFTLMHDDIMDQAPKRRGNTTVHEKWDVNTAILSGDAMLIESYKYLHKLPADLFHKIFGVFNSAALEVCEGQQMDMNFEEESQVSIQNYLSMISKKTAVLLAAAFKIGAVIGGASDEDAEGLYLFGKHIGIAFQLQDDILDVFADEDKFGKQVGGDIICNKKTFLLLKALELAKGDLQMQLESFMHGSFSNEEKVKGVKEIYTSLKVQELATKEMEYHYNTAISYLEKLNIDASRKENFYEMATFIKVREM